MIARLFPVGYWAFLRRPLREAVDTTTPGDEPGEIPTPNPHQA
ncbi:MAG: hypothetical protein QM622_10525 [Microbacterium sp.]